MNSPSSPNSPRPIPRSTTSTTSNASQTKTQAPKALRFVTNYGAPHPKRRRIGAACMTCRKRKTACSGERPFCETCKQNKLECGGYSNDNPYGSGHKHAASELNAPDEHRKIRHSPDSASGQEKDFARPVPQHSPERPVQPSKEKASSSDGQDQAEAESASSETWFNRPRNRMPYFRWLGPTAIMPGFKQMVVKVKRTDTDVARSSTDGVVSPSLNNLNGPNITSSMYSGTSTITDADTRTPLNLPFYDTSTMPPSELITHLANTFFTHLGCNYPFLQHDRFLKDLEEKQVDAVLVDAVCALAARFSTHALLKQQQHDENKLTPAEHGHAFAMRAKTAIVEAFPCPSVAAVQAALLLAYNEFGESRDSGLWMYLGIAIRMAQDLGMHKLEGLRYKGTTGPTPKMVKHESNSNKPAAVSTAAAVPLSPSFPSNAELDASNADQGDTKDVIAEQKAVEQERVDTFWAVFFLDRVVSSGTGRRSTLRDKEIEISFPALDKTDSKSGWPAPFPALIRIVHLYGRVADLLNTIKEPSDITPQTPKRLAAMETQVTQFYQGLSPRLHFDAVNFQHYMKAGEGTNFVLLHFWFHMLIVLLHQPTLLKTFEGRMLQLFPNSQQLSMSSAKTIADILSYSQLMDAKASLGNPFTSQPIYIAACAFLKETVDQTATSNAQSRASSPTRKDDHQGSEVSSFANASPAATKRLSISGVANSRRISIAADKTLAKHTLLATAASQHYQLCYKALQSLETYWAGAKYILTVLNQKFEGVGDPLLYTAEESESAMEQPRPEPAFTSPGWRRKLSWGPCGRPFSMESPFLPSRRLAHVPGSPGVDPSKAIGWTLTGTMNSPSTNLAWHYSNNTGNLQNGVPASDGPYGYDPAPSRVNGRDVGRSAPYRVSPVGHGQDRSPHRPHPAFPTSTSVSNADADLLLGLNSPYPTSIAATGSHANQQLYHHPAPSPDGTSTYTMPFSFQMGSLPFAYTQNLGDMTIESQDVDMSMLGLDMPWFDSVYPMGMFDPDADAQDPQVPTGLPNMS